MLNLTRPERSVLIVLAMIFLFGLVGHYLLKMRFFSNAFNVLDSDKIFPRLDLNRVAYEDLLPLPGIGPQMARRIIAYREENGPFAAIEEIKSIPGIGEKNYRTLKIFFFIRQKRK